MTKSALIIVSPRGFDKATHGPPLATYAQVFETPARKEARRRGIVGSSLWRHSIAPAGSDQLRTDRMTTAELRAPHAARNSVSVRHTPSKIRDLATFEIRALPSQYPRVRHLVLAPSATVDRTDCQR